MSKSKTYTRDEIQTESKIRVLQGKLPRKYLIHGDIKNDKWYFISDLPNVLLREAALSNSSALPEAHQSELLKEVCLRLEKTEK